MMHKEFRITRDANRCVGCNECFIVCPQSKEDDPHSVLVPARDKGKPPEIRSIGNCIQCMTCWDLCRSQAITFEHYHQVARLVQDMTLQRKVARII